jgi:hypothetical protein
VGDVAGRILQRQIEPLLGLRIGLCPAGISMADVMMKIIIISCLFDQKAIFAFAEKGLLKPPFLRAQSISHFHVVTSKRGQTGPESWRSAALTENRTVQHGAGQASQSQTRDILNAA